jgi:hypothetical protein
MSTNVMGFQYSRKITNIFYILILVTTVDPHGHENLGLYMSSNLGFKGKICQYSFSLFTLRFK